MGEKTQDRCLMGYSSAYSIGRERGFFRGEGERWKGFDNWIEMRKEGEI
jgi:hypothetical protein